MHPPRKQVTVMKNLVNLLLVAYLIFTSYGIVFLASSIRELSNRLKRTGQLTNEDHFAVTEEAKLAGILGTLCLIILIFIPVLVIALEQHQQLK